MNPRKPCKSCHSTDTSRLRWRGGAEHFYRVVTTHVCHACGHQRDSVPQPDTTPTEANP